MAVTRPGGQLRVPLGDADVYDVPVAAGDLPPVDGDPYGMAGTLVLIRERYRVIGERMARGVVEQLSG